MTYSKFIHIFILISSLLFSSESAWATTTFERYWNLAFNQNRFREPVNFTPFEARIGYLTYGGNDYWDDFLSTDLGAISPVILDSTNYSFDYLQPVTSRTLAFIEFDFMKVNIPNWVLNKLGWSQNFLDIQTGLGYRYIHSISEPALPEYWENTVPDNPNPGTLLFKPRLNDFNINTSIDYQPFPQLRAYLYHSLGYSFGTIYEYSGTGNYLECFGVSEGFGIGAKYVTIFEKYDFNLAYGLEFRLHRLYINEVDDPSKISHITGLDIYSKGLIFSISTIFGGQKTSADYSFRKMLDYNYISAEEGFSDYIDSRDNPPREKLAQKMLTFTQSQIPYQQYNNGLQHQYSGSIDSAIYWFNQAAFTANKDLLFEINAHRKDLAIMLVDSVSVYKSEMTFEIAENILLKAKKISNDYYYVNESLSDLYLEKGDAFNSVSNYNKAYIYYKKSELAHSTSKVKLIDKYYILTENLINESNNASKRGEYALAIESLNFALDISPDRKVELDPVIDNLYSQLSSEEAVRVKERISDIVNMKKTEIENALNKKILIGMSSNEVEEAIGLPFIKDSIEQGDRTYELWTYNNRPNLTRVYFEENLVVKVE